MERRFEGLVEFIRVFKGKGKGKGLRVSERSITEAKRQSNRSFKPFVCLFGGRRPAHTEGHTACTLNLLSPSYLPNCVVCRKLK